MLDLADKFGSELLKVVQVWCGERDFTHRFTIGIVRVGGKAESDDAFVGFLGGDVELRQARERSGDEWKDAGGERIERAKMADGALLEDAAHAVDYIVRGPTGRFVDDDNAVHRESSDRATV